MKINELMIGDLVNIAIEGYNNPTRIREIGSFWVKVIKDEMEYGNILVTPIPLTTEILEKNGFVWDDSPISQCWEQYGLIIYPVGGGYRMNCGQNVSFKIDSVHELQHLFKLCGIDKEIEL